MGISKERRQTSPLPDVPGPPAPGEMPRKLQEKESIKIKSYDGKLYSSPNKDLQKSQEPVKFKAYGDGSP